MKWVAIFAFSLACLGQSFSLNDRAFVANANIHNPLRFIGGTLACPGQLVASTTRHIQQGGLTGALFDSGTNTPYNTYGRFGPTMTNGVVEASFYITAEYPSVPMNTNDFPTGNGSLHSGPCVRFQSDTDFAGMALVSASAGQFQIVDRVTSNETVTNMTVNGGIATNTTYIIRVENLSGNVATAYLMSSDRTVITNYTWTFHAGTPSSGQAAFHTYGTACKVATLKQWNQNGTVKSVAYAPWVAVQSVANSQGLYITNGILTVYTDGTNGGVTNTWGEFISPVVVSNGTFTGSMNLISGRSSGLSFRCDGAGTGYHLWYDDNTKQLRLWKGILDGVSGNAPTSILNVSATNTLGTSYPFTLSLSGTNISFTCNGFTCATNDATYSSGYIGVMGFTDKAQFSGLGWHPQ